MPFFVPKYHERRNFIVFRLIAARVDALANRRVSDGNYIELAVGLQGAFAERRDDAIKKRRRIRKLLFFWDLIEIC